MSKKYKSLVEAETAFSKLGRASDIIMGSIPEESSYNNIKLYHANNYFMRLENSYLALLTEIQNLAQFDKNQLLQWCSMAIINFEMEATTLRKKYRELREKKSSRESEYNDAQHFESFKEGLYDINRIKGLKYELETYKEILMIMKWQMEHHNLLLKNLEDLYEGTNIRISEPRKGPSANLPPHVITFLKKFDDFEELIETLIIHKYLSLSKEGFKSFIYILDFVSLSSNNEIDMFKILGKHELADQKIHWHKPLTHFADLLLWLILEGYILPIDKGSMQPLSNHFADIFDFEKSKKAGDHKGVIRKTIGTRLNKDIDDSPINESLSTFLSKLNS